MFLSHEAVVVCYSGHRNLIRLLPGAPSMATAPAVSLRSRRQVRGGPSSSMRGPPGQSQHCVASTAPARRPRPLACPRADGQPVRSEATRPGAPYRSRPICSHGLLGSPAGAELTGRPAPLRPLHCRPAGKPAAFRAERPLRAVRKDGPHAPERGSCSGPRRHAGTMTVTGMTRTMEMSVTAATHLDGASC